MLTAVVDVAVRVRPVQDKEGIRNKLTQFATFCMVGVTNTAVSYFTNIAVLSLVNLICPGLSFDYIIANVVAFLLSVYWSFFWNSRKVFNIDTRNKALRRRALLRSYVCYGMTGIVLNNLLSTLWIRGLGISKYLAPLINLLITIPVNYLTNKKWAFSVKDSGAASGGDGRM